MLRTPRDCGSPFDATGSPPEPWCLEVDSCGIGFVADIHGRRRHAILQMALEALGNLSHRGGVAVDGRSSDGVGIQTGLPYPLLLDTLARSGVSQPPLEELALAMCFLPREAEQRQPCIDLMKEIFAAGELKLLAWRPVPMNRHILEGSARKTCPHSLQAILRRPPGLDSEAFERRLFLTRKRLETRSRLAGLDDLYIVSLSHRTVVYKGMSVGSELASLFPDLQDANYRTPFALFHQRFSTNTLPSWRLAQPFRMLAHNGEINTLEGNRNWMAARQSDLASPLWKDSIDELLPVLDALGSDSGQLDNALEMLVMLGRDPLHSMMMLIPEAVSEQSLVSPEIKDFYDYHATLMEPWDGPAAVVFSDGRWVVAALDRNGLRPQRYWVTLEGLVVLGSEAGIVRIPEHRIVQRGRLGPGQMLAVDLIEERLWLDRDIKQHYASRRPYGEWLREHLLEEPEVSFPEVSEEEDGDALVRHQKCFGYSSELFDRILDPMLKEGRQPVGSMGDDTPPAALSEQPQLLYGFFKQRFAQVTNPSIDSLRERLALSLEVMVGAWGRVSVEHLKGEYLLRCRSPIIHQGQLQSVLGLAETRFRHRTFSATYEVAAGYEELERRLLELCDEVEAAVDDGCVLLHLRDGDVDGKMAPLPMLLVTAAVHHHLIRRQKRMQVSLIVETDEAREDHHLACLIGFGATLVCPSLALRSVAWRAQQSDLPVATAQAKYLQAAEEGLLKIMAKLGVGPVSSYQGAQLFEALGLDAALVRRFFTGTPQRIGGIGLPILAQHIERRHGEAFEAQPKLVDHGYFRFRKGGEQHALRPGVFKALHRAVRGGRQEDFETYLRSVEDGPVFSLRDLLRWRSSDAPLDLEAVEPAASLCRRFVSAAMSLGALSREAHETLAVAMNRLGGRSNSGEGGEAVERFQPYTEATVPSFSGPWQPQPGDWGNSAIKQVASGRFGVTPQYLSSARQIEIKMAQGSKPGEGGQIPGHKVSLEIAAVRRSKPGVTLISPPPHHDIYSIEDLAQLIHDLRRVHPRAGIGVKLVAGAGVGTIAAGVVKAGADYIHLSGDSGGTGASPLSSIKHAGLPWELGLVEVQRQLVTSGLRHKVTLRVDGGLKTGRDVVMAAILGADEFAFGTVPLIAIGCIMARQCHLNTCPVGIATQRPELRQKFPGTPERVVAFFSFIAEEIRGILALLGVSRLDEIIGRVELLEQKEDRPGSPSMDVSYLLRPSGSGGLLHGDLEAPPRRVQDPGLDEVLWQDSQQVVERGGSCDGVYDINNRQLAVGARLSGEIARRYGHEGLREGSLRFEMRGVAGQSFGAFLARGVALTLVGEAQDFVGKGLAGGEISMRPSPASSINSHRQVIAGNTVLYGATSGRCFLAGRVGERFCVRNSGAEAVVEGCGDHACEYMTGGVAVILGPVGRNFGAGMSAGVALVYDENGSLASRLASGSVVLADGLDRQDRSLLKSLLRQHVQKTGSPWAATLLEVWRKTLPRFQKVIPAALVGTGEQSPWQGEDTSARAEADASPGPQVVNG